MYDIKKLKSDISGPAIVAVDGYHECLKLKIKFLKA